MAEMRERARRAIHRVVHDDEEAARSVSAVQDDLFTDAVLAECRYAELVGALRWFCKRVDDGEIRSRETYARFQDLLRDLGEIE